MIRQSTFIGVFTSGVRICPDTSKHAIPQHNPIQSFIPFPDTHDYKSLFLLFFDPISVNYERVVWDSTKYHNMCSFQNLFLSSRPLNPPLPSFILKTFLKSLQFHDLHIVTRRRRRIDTMDTSMCLRTCVLLGLNRNFETVIEL